MNTNIVKTVDDGKCIMYWQFDETVEYLIMGFPVLAKAEFIVMIWCADN
jgi:hypothetical protein